jgi:hypothetical protein
MSYNTHLIKLDCVGKKNSESSLVTTEIPGPSPSCTPTGRPDHPSLGYSTARPAQEPERALYMSLTLQCLGITVFLLLCSEKVGNTLVNLFR